MEATASRIACLQCLECGKESSVSAALYVCPDCRGNQQVVYDYALAKRRLTRQGLKANRDLSLWRYLPLLPVARRPAAGPATGWTPLYKADKLARGLGLAGVFVKDEGRNPSASLKDRASAVVVARALEQNRTAIAAASTGNAASSLACAMGTLEFKPIIFVPKAIPSPKLAQLLLFGATVIAVEGDYDDAFELCEKACKKYGWYNRNTGTNPYTREGKKTCAFEICEQLGWRVPDLVFIPVGDGNIISGLWKGFREFHTLGLIKRLPKLVAVQAEGSDAVCRALESGGRFAPVGGRTLADSISVRRPRDGRAAVRAVQDSGGFALRVSDAELLAAMRELARKTGVFAEPAGAASYAGLKKTADEGRLEAGQTVVLVVTGSGLKDVDSAIKAAGRPHLIEPDLKALDRLLKTKDLAARPAACAVH